MKEGTGKKGKEDKKSSILTRREQEILNKLLSRKSPKEIGYELKIKYNTVLMHQKKLYRKMGVQSIQELIVKELSTKSNQKVPDVFTRIAAFKDNIGSSISVLIREEKINGENYPCYYIKGRLFKALGVYTGIFLYPDSTTLEVMKKSSCFSFNVLGDGNDYEVMLTTSDTSKEEEENHFRKAFKTVKNEISVINVNVSELAQSGVYGIKTTFIQNNVEGIQFQAITHGIFKLKIWDIRFCP